MAWIKEFHSPFDLIDTIYIALGLSGLYFFNRRKDENGRYFYYPETDHKFYVPSIYIVHIIAGLSLQWWYVPKVLLHSSYDIWLFEILHLHLSASGIYSIIMLQKRSHLFIEACRMILDIDIIMSLKNVNPHYSLIRKFSYLPFVFPIPFIFIIIKIYKTELLQSNFWITLISEHQCFAVPLAIHSYSLYYFSIFELMIYQRLKDLNQCLQEMKRETNLGIAEEELIALARVHSDLCKVWKYISYLFGWPVTAHHILTYILITAFGLYQLDVAFRTIGFQVSMFCIWLTAVNFCSILAGELLQREGFQTGIVLCELVEVEHFFESNVTVAAKTFHLQLLHSNLHIILCGFFDLSIEHFGEVLKSIANFIMFIVQMKT